MGESIAEFTENLAVKQAKSRLSELAFEKSKRIELGMSKVKYNAESIALQMHQILSNPEKYKPINKVIYTYKNINIKYLKVQIY